jgi:hypothetical protein
MRIALFVETQTEKAICIYMALNMMINLVLFIGIIKAFAQLNADGVITANLLMF